MSDNDDRVVSFEEWLSGKRADRPPADPPVISLEDWVEDAGLKPADEKPVNLGKWLRGDSTKLPPPLRRIDTSDAGQARVWAYIEGIADRQAKLTQGSRNDTQNSGAYKAFRLAIGAGIPLERVEEIIYRANVLNGQVSDDGEKQVRDTMRSARTSAERDGPDHLAPNDTVDTPPAFTIDPELIDNFWSARPVLAHIHRFAQSRAAGPWGALGSVLVRAMCAVPPHIALPPITGGPMSLNMFVTLVGSSGMGKNASDAVGRESVQFRYARLASYPIELPIGTGEGIAKTFRQADADEDNDDAPITAIFNAPEVDTLTTLGGRQGSTIDGEIRKLYSGEQLGFANAQKHTRTRVAAHSYRAGLIVGAQPLRCDALLKSADGGTPQRFLWLPVNDLTAPDELPGTPEPLTIDIPAFVGPHLKVPDQIRVEVLVHRRAMLRGEPVDQFDGHRLLSRLKVAAALMVLDSPNRDGGSGITAEDWRLAGIVMQVSDQTREWIQREVAQKVRADNRARGHTAADREEILEDRRIQRLQDRAERAILSKLRKVGRTKERLLRKACDVTIRDYFDPALDRLLTSGDVLRIKGDEGRADEYELP